MARRPRLDLPGIAQHIVQRGNNRSACFFNDRHRDLYRNLLGQTTRAAGVALHAYVLMGNHVHLLMTAPQPGLISDVMREIGRAYVQRINAALGRSGTLFQGRFKSHPVQTDRYLLCCYRYIELNPVRAGLCSKPAAYPWSSYRCNALGEPDGLVTPHPVFTGLAAGADQVRADYRAFVAAGASPRECEQIRLHLGQGCAWGDSAFQADVARGCGRRADLASRGRPRRINGPDPFIF